MTDTLLFLGDREALQPLCNRAPDGSFRLPADGWYQLVPKGEFPIIPTGVVNPRKVTQVIDDAAIDAIMNRFGEDSKDPNFRGVLFDFEHLSYSPRTPEDGKAAGWVEQLDNRGPQGIWGKVKWSAKGLAAVSGGEYRYVSPTFHMRDVQEVGSDRYRPLRLGSVALTNQPNLRGMAPLTNRTPDGAAGNSKPKPHMKDIIAPLLGLPAEATDAQVIVGVQALMNRATMADAAKITFENRINELNTKLQAAEAKAQEVEIESVINKFANRFTAEDMTANRGKLKSALLANREVAEWMLESMPILGKKAPAAAMHNRSNTELKTPAAATDEPETAEQLQETIVTETNAIMANRKCTYAEAFGALERTKPELFTNATRFCPSR